MNSSYWLPHFLVTILAGRRVHAYPKLPRYALKQRAHVGEAGSYNPDSWLNTGPDTSRYLVILKI